MGRVDRATVRAFLQAVVPRDARGVVLRTGKDELVLLRSSPIPWEAIEETAARGEEISVVPSGLQAGGALQAASCVWVHLAAEGAAPSEVAARLSPAAPAAVVACGHAATAYWRVHPLSLEEACRLMDEAAAMTGGVPGYPEETCRLPLAPEELWAAAQPTVWAPEALLAALQAARRLAQQASRPEPPRPEPGQQPQEPERPEGLWEEACAAASGSAEAARALVEALIAARGDPEQALRELGVESAAAIGGVLRVLRDGRWHRVELRRAELTLAPDSASEGLADQPEV